MLTDAAAIGLSLLAVHLAAKPAEGTMTFGFKRAEILSAQFNGATLFVLALVIVYEAIHRLVSPPTVEGTAVLIVALVGIAVNLAASYTLTNAKRQSMNIEGSFKHILTDLAGFIATAIAGGIILATGFRRADPIASLLIAAIMLSAAYALSGRVFLEGAPKGWTRVRSAARWPGSPAYARSTTCMFGRSPRGSPPSRHTSWSACATTATRSATPSSDSCTTNSRLSTPPCRSNTSTRSY
jgi:cation diffusion facilitator family transporter